MYTKTITFRDELKSLLFDFCEKKFPITVCFTYKKEVVCYSSKFHGVCFDDDITNYLCIEMLNPFEANNNVDKNLDIHILANVGSKRYQFDSKCVKKEFSNKTIVLTIPKIICSDERREYKRYKPEDNIICKINYNNNLKFSGVLLDISKGGLSFVSQLANTDIMKKGKQFEVSFELNHRARIYKIEVCYFSHGICGCKFI